MNIFREGKKGIGRLRQGFALTCVTLNPLKGAGRGAPLVFAYHVFCTTSEVVLRQKAGPVNDLKSSEVPCLEEVNENFKR